MAQNVVVPPFETAPETIVGATPQSEFAFGFPFWDSSDIVVKIAGLKADTADYVVQGYFVQNGVPVEGGYGSGKVTLNTPVANTTVTIDRRIRAVRESVFSRAAPLQMPALNADLNKLTARQQDVERQVRDVEKGVVDPDVLAEVVDEAVIPATAVKADRDGGNIDPATEALVFNAKLEQHRRPFDKPLMDFVTDVAAADWKPYFDAAVDWAAANAPNGVRFTLPRNVAPGGIPLSYVKPILSDGVYFVGKGRAVWTGTYLAGTDKCDIRLLGSGSNPTFTWGNNAYNAAAPGGFTQRGGGLRGLNIRAWDATSWLAVTKGMVNPQFKDIWCWVPFSGIQIQNGLDPEIERVHIEAYRDAGIEVNGTGVGTGGDPREGRGDRGFARDVLVVGAGDEAGPTGIRPGFAVRGYWHTFDCDAVRIVKGGGPQAIWVGDRRNTNSNKRPHFITFNNTQIDFVKARALEIDDAVDVWFNGALYLNGSPLEQIKIGANARRISIKNARGFGSKTRMVTVGGKEVSFLGGSFRFWDSDGVSTETCVYIEPTASAVSFESVDFGDADLVPSTHTGKRAVYAPPEATGSLSVVGCGFYDLASNPVEIGGTRFNSAGCVTQFGPAPLPMGASRLFLGTQEFLPGSHAYYGVGDIAIAYDGATVFFNSYYDGSNFRRVAAGAAAYAKNEASGLGLYQGPSGAAGATFAASLVARLNADGTFRVNSRMGVGREPVPGSSVVATAGDVSIGGAVPTACFNLYYDGSAWRYLGNGPGAAIKVVLDGSASKLQLITAPNNAGGAGAAATVAVAGYLTAA